MSDIKRIFLPNEWELLREELRGLEKRVIFTNGCFDMLHEGIIQ